LLSRLSRFLQLRLQKQIQHQYEFNRDELEYMSDAIKFLLACLDSESIYLRSDLMPLLAKVERMVHREEAKA
jgi:hypothetical protein